MTTKKVVKEVPEEEKKAEPKAPKVVKYTVVRATPDNKFEVVKEDEVPKGYCIIQPGVSKNVADETAFTQQKKWEKGLSLHERRQLN